MPTKKGGLQQLHINYIVFIIKYSAIIQIEIYCEQVAQQTGRIELILVFALGQRHRRWSNIKTALGQGVVFVGWVTCWSSQRAQHTRETTSLEKKHEVFYACIIIVMRDTKNIDMIGVSFR